MDALYFSVTTLTTVGLGDLAPKTAPGKLFTVLYIFVGLGIVGGIHQHVGQGVLEHGGRATEWWGETRRRFG